MEEDTDAPPERDTKDFVFRQLTKLRIFEPPQELPKDRSALLAISNKYGVLFVGSPFGLKIFSTNEVLIPIKTGVDPNSVVASPPGIDVQTKYPVHHVALSFDNLTLSVCMSSSDSGCIISFYDTRTLLNKARQPKQAFASQRLLQDAGSFVADLKWNPVASNVAICLSDGSISVLQVTDTVSLYASLPPATGVTSVCWSPKGKQLAVGKQNGTVVQYLPNLQEKKVIPCPSFYDSDNPVKVLDVLWISTYVFAVVYAAADGSVETSPQLVMVLLPKKEDKRGERFLNFTEICYCSVNNERQHHFFMNYMEDWGVLLGASAASIEVSVIAKLPEQNTWELWILEDAGRAELPLSDNSDDTLPMGVVLDYTSRLQIEITEEKVLPPSPILMILSTDGVLCPFHVINYNPNVKSLNTPLEELRLEGERQPKSASSVPSHPPQGPGAPSTTLSAINPAFSIPVSSLASKVQPTPPAFSLPVTTSKPAQVFTPATASFPSKPQTTSQVFGAPAASFPSKPQATAQGFGATVPSLPSKPQATAQGFGATVPSLPSKPQASASHFGITGPVGKPQESTMGFSFSANSPSASVGTAHPGFSVPSNPQGFSSAVQGPPAFGTPTSKPDNSINIAQQAVSSSFAFSTSNVKVNLSAKFSAAEPAATKPAFTPHSQSYPLTPPVKSTVAAVPQSTIGPPSIQSPSMMAPNRSFPDGQPQQATPVMRQKALKISSSEVKQTPPQPQATNPILNAIQEEIAHFQKEMDELKARTAKARFIVGTAEEMRRLRTECNDLDSFVRDIKATTESLHNDNGCLQTTLRDAFTTVQDAKELNEKKKNPVYCRLLQQRPLDPKSEAQMQEIRRLNQYVEYAIQDVNNVLDYRWDQYLSNRKKQRGIAVPQRETLFNTLASHQEIISQQRQRLNQLVANLQELGLYNQTSQLTVQIDTSNGQRQFEEELKNLQIAMAKTALETKPQPSPKVQPKMSKLKLNQLRNFLANRKPPVVRSLAPVNLCRSSFLAPSYFEDLDDVSSTSSLSEAADNEEMQAPPQHEAFKRETPPPELSAVRTVRHAPVTRTASMQPGFGTPSLPFGKSQSQIGPITSTPAVPAQSIRVIPQGADSTMLATKTVKHGAPTVTASQAAAAAALRRQMSCQVSASLTESTLQTVPQVVNVKELKSNGPGPNISTVIGPSVPQSAAQVINQVLVTVGSAPIKQVQLQPPSGFKTPSASAPTSNVIAQSGSGLATNKPGQTSSKFEAQTTTSSTGLTSGLQGNKAFSFSGPSGVFPMGNGAPSSAPSSSQGSIAQVKDASLPTPFINNNGNKFHFGLGTEANFAFGPPKPATGISTASPSDSTSAKSTSAQAPPLTTSQSTGVGMASAQTFTGGETLGSFSGLRVGQAEDVPKTEPPKVTPSIQPVKISGGAPLTGIGGFQPSKPVEPASTASSSSTMFGNMKLTNPGIAGVFNSTGIKQNFSFTTPATTTSETEVSSTTQVASSLPFGGFIAPSTSLQTPTTTVSASLPTPVPSSTPVEAKQPAPEKPLNEPVVLPPQLQALLTAATESSKEPASAQTISTTERTMATVPAVIPTVAKTNTPVSVFSTTASSNLNVPITSTPTSISHLSPPAAATSEGPSSKTPVLVTSAPTLGPTSTPVTSASAGSTATASSFGQPPEATAPTATTAGSLFGQAPAPSTGTLFGQPSNTSTTTSGITTSGFGTPGFGSADGGGGFGQPTFGQTASLWKAPASSASSFSFAPSAFGSQPAFGQAPASTAATSSGGSLFGASANTSSASSFSFGQPSTGNNASTSGGLFGQSSTPVFGQGSTFGQSAPVFGSASSSTTTTTSSSAFSFAQPSAFGSNSTGSVFGQSQSGNANVFGQASSTSGGLFGSSSNSTGGGFFSGLGGKPSQEAANKNPFGSSTTGFGSPSSANTNSLFGNSGAKSFGFGNTSFGEQKTTGTFSAGGSVATQGFGFSSPTKTGGFGAAPVFGSPPTFGGSPGFGGVPAFGSAPNFSSPLGSNGGKVFGEGTAAANTGGFGFGSNTPTATFGNLASQTTPTFGTLSQQGPGFGGQNSGFPGFGSGSGGAASGSSGGFAFGASNQSTSAFGGGWRG